MLRIDIRLAAHTQAAVSAAFIFFYRRRSGDRSFRRPIADQDVVVKYVFDKVVGAICLIRLCPLMALIALAIKLDSPNPVLFKRGRHYFNNEPIDVCKFRSLYAAHEDSKAMKQVTRDDPRLTRVGRFIRRTSLDELPQFFKVVFAGNLSGEPARRGRFGNPSNLIYITLRTRRYFSMSILGDDPFCAAEKGKRRLKLQGAGMFVASILTAVAALQGAAGVSFAAAAAHVNANPLLATESQFLMIHAAAGLGLAARADNPAPYGRLFCGAALALQAGVTLFSADLAARVYLGAKLFPYAAPMGGSLTILAWLALAFWAIMGISRSVKLR